MNTLILSSQLNILPLKTISSFIIRISNIFSLCLYLAHSSLRNLRNTMTKHETFRVICQPLSSDSGADDGLDFICCVGGREPQINKLWSFAEDRITCEVHSFVQITVGNFSGDCFQTDYATEIGRRVAIYGQESTNRSVKGLDVPAPFCNTGVAWTENILFPSLHWGDGVWV